MFLSVRCGPGAKRTWAILLPSTSSRSLHRFLPILKWDRSLFTKPPESEVGTFLKNRKFHQIHPPRQRWNVAKGSPGRKGGEG